MNSNAVFELKNRIVLTSLTYLCIVKKNIDILTYHPRLERWFGLALCWMGCRRIGPSRRVGHSESRVSWLKRECLGPALTAGPFHSGRLSHGPLSSLRIEILAGQDDLWPAVRRVHGWWQKEFNHWTTLFRFFWCRNNGSILFMGPELYPPFPLGIDAFFVVAKEKRTNNS